jgi:hypothetical protein
MAQVLAEHFKTASDTYYPLIFQEIKEQEETAIIIPEVGEDPGKISAHNPGVRKPSGFPRKTTFLASILRRDKSLRYLLALQCDPNTKRLANKRTLAPFCQKLHGRQKIQSYTWRRDVYAMLFLVAINQITQNVALPTKIIGYANDWVIYTRDHHDMQNAQTNLQLTVNTIASGAGNIGFHISPEKTVCMHICRLKLKIATHPDPQITLDGRILEVALVHKTLGVTFDSELNWKRHSTDVRERAIKRLNLLKCLASKHWGADENSLIRVHQMVLLGSLEYGSLWFCPKRTVAEIKSHP